MLNASELRYNRQWQNKIEEHKQVLLPMYRSKVRFPSPPFKPETITSYIADVRPYLLVSQVVRKWGLTMSVGLFLTGFIVALVW